MERNTIRQIAVAQDDEKAAISIIREFLLDNGYDGLYNAYSGCNCTLDCLAHCGEICTDCAAGTKTSCGGCSRKDGCGRGEGDEWCVGLPDEEIDEEAEDAL